MCVTNTERMKVRLSSCIPQIVWASGNIKKKGGEGIAMIF